MVKNCLIFCLPMFCFSFSVLGPYNEIIVFVLLQSIFTFLEQTTSEILLASFSERVLVFIVSYENQFHSLANEN